MNVIRWAESRSRAMTLWDTGALKIYCVLFGALIGAYFPSFVRQNVAWFVAGVVVFGGYFAYRWFTARSEPDDGRSR